MLDLFSLNSIWQFIVNLSEEWTLGMLSFWQWFNTPMDFAFLGLSGFTPASIFTISGILTYLIYRFIRFMTV